MVENWTATGPSQASRRALLAGAGGLGAGMVLAGCGDDGPYEADATAPTGDSTAPASGGASGDGGAALGMTSEVPVGGGRVFADRQVVVTQPSEGTFKGFSAICTHQGCPLASVEGGTINCSCHGSKFSIEDGSVRNGPASAPLAAKKIKVDGDQITLA